MAPGDPQSADPPVLNVSVVYSPRAGTAEQDELQLPPGACVRDALQQSTMLRRHPELDVRGGAQSLLLGVWGKLRGPDHPLRDQDRIEVYRPLQVDPKEARRLRYRQHRARAKV